MRWAIWDKNKFQCLIQDLSYFTTRLNDLVPDKHLIMTPMKRWDTDGQRLEKLKLVMDCFKDESAVRSAGSQSFQDTKRILVQTAARLFRCFDLVCHFVLEKVATSDHLPKLLMCLDDLVVELVDLSKQMSGKQERLHRAQGPNMPSLC